MASAIDHCTTMYCGLCLVKFESNDVVVTRKFRLTLKKHCSKLYRAASPGASTSRTFVFQHRCLPSCEHSNGLASGFHQDCFQLWKPYADNINSVTRSAFFWSPKYATAKSIVSNTIAPSLARNLKLPLELCHYIGSDLICLYNAAAVTAINPSNPKYFEVDISQNIWACFVKFHLGVYICSLSNVQPATNTQSETNTRSENSHPKIWVHIHRPTEAHDTVYLARDSWGIRKIVFGSHNDRLVAQDSCDVWWAAMRINPRDGKLQSQTDVGACPAVMQFLSLLSAWKRQ